MSLSKDYAMTIVLIIVMMVIMLIACPNHNPRTNEGYVKYVVIFNNRVILDGGGLYHNTNNSAAIKAQIIKHYTGLELPNSKEFMEQLKAGDIWVRMQ